jgi:hypothetical protein
LPLHLREATQHSLYSIQSQALFALKLNYTTLPVVHFLHPVHAKTLKIPHQPAYYPSHSSPFHAYWYIGLVLLLEEGRWQTPKMAKYTSTPIVLPFIAGDEITVTKITLTLNANKPCVRPRFPHASCRCRKCNRCEGKEPPSLSL